MEFILQINTYCILEQENSVIITKIYQHQSVYLQFRFFPRDIHLVCDCGMYVLIFVFCSVLLLLQLTYQVVIITNLW